MEAGMPPPPPAVILQLVTNLWATKSVATFARLRGPDGLASGPKTAAALAAELGVHEGALARLLRGIALAGIVNQSSDGRWALTPVGEVLRSDVPGSMRALLIAETAPGHWLPWGEMEHSIRTGGPATTKALGTDAWSYYRQHPDEANDFAEGMSGISTMAAMAVLGTYDFSACRRVVDVGGSHGTMLAGVLSRVPEAKGVLFDLPDVVAGAAPTLRAAGVDGRVEIVPGSFFDGVPSGGDTYLLKFILHDWSDDECVGILKKVRSALAPNGRVVVIEMLIGDTAPSPAPLLDLNMLVMLTGRERSLPEFEALFARAGLKLTGHHRTPSPFHAIEAKIA
jgi:hypothetical protein